MRLATTWAVGHDGKDIPLFGPSVPLDTQRKELLKLRASKTHPDYALVIFQETDSNEPAWKLRFIPEPEPAVVPQEPKKKAR